MIMKKYTQIQHAYIQNTSSNEDIENWGFQNTSTLLQGLKDLQAPQIPPVLNAYSLNRFYLFKCKHLEVNHHSKINTARITQFPHLLKCN